jgi:hypothetical protein
VVQVDEAATRLAALEAKEAIRALKHQYAALCDDGYVGDRIAELFTEDGVWSSSEHGVVAGRSEIARFMSGLGASQFLWAVHFMSNPRICASVPSDTAEASWQLLQLATLRNESAVGARSVLAVGTYTDQLVSREGRWFFSRVHLELHRVTSLREGW